jgi:hypothetical protein
MSALATDALCGIAVAGAASDLAGGLATFGAELVVGDAPADVLIVAIDGGARAPEESADQSTAAYSLDAAANGALATAVAEAFGAARDGLARLRPGKCMLFVLTDASADHADTDPARAAIGSLTRTLALEWAPERRVNALVCARSEDAVEAVALIAWRASRTLTGAVIDIVG